MDCCSWCCDYIHTNGDEYIMKFGGGDEYIMKFGGKE